MNNGATGDAAAFGWQRQMEQAALWCRHSIMNRDHYGVHPWHHAVAEEILAAWKLGFSRLPCTRFYSEPLLQSKAERELIDNTPTAARR